MEVEDKMKRTFARFKSLGKGRYLLYLNAIVFGLLLIILREVDRYESD